MTILSREPMNKIRRAHIHELAEAVRKECGVDTPVDMSMAVERLGGRVVFDPYVDYEARIEKNGDGFLITLKEDPREARSRFSIAHELGHLFLHMGFLDDEKWQEVGQYTDSAYYRFGHTIEEYEAHEFAGAFLMPKDEFIQVSRQFESNGEYDVTRIADQFGVSAQAALTRGRWLGLFSWQ